MALNTIDADRNVIAQWMPPWQLTLNGNMITGHSPPLIYFGGTTNRRSSGAPRRNCRKRGTDLGRHMCENRYIAYNTNRRVFPLARKFSRSVITVFSRPQKCWFGQGTNAVTPVFWRIPGVRSPLPPATEIPIPSQHLCRARPTHMPCPPSPQSSAVRAFIRWWQFPADRIECPWQLHCQPGELAKSTIAP
jgi:hypothetical protein